MNIWQEIIIKLSSKDIGKANGIASKLSSYGTFIEDYSDLEQTLPLVGNFDYIDEKLLNMDKNTALIHVYCEKIEELMPLKTSLEIELKRANIAVTLEEKSLGEQNFAEDWKSQHKAEKISNRFVLCPSFQEYEAKDDELILKIDPNRASGSGQGITTKLCLELLEKEEVSGKKVLDMGCGSGILAIASLLLGAKSALGVDIDPQAIKESKENAKINGVADRFFALSGNVANDEKLCEKLGKNFDIILANIVADVHLMMGNIYAQKLKNGGKLLLSGIIASREDEIQEFMEGLGFEMVEKNSGEEFFGMGFVKI